MIFEIDKIDEEGQSFEVLEPKQHFHIDSPDCVLTEDVKIQGRLGKIGHEILCQGLLETGLLVTCTRCLIGFSFPVKNKLRVHFIARVENDKTRKEIELTDLDFEQEFYEEGRIDLSCPARDLILLSLPQVRLCREDRSSPPRRGFPRAYRPSAASGSGARSPGRPWRNPLPRCRR